MRKTSDLIKEEKQESLIYSSEMSMARVVLSNVCRGGGGGGGRSSHGSNSLCARRLIVIGKQSLGCLENLLRNSIHRFPRRQRRSNSVVWCDYTVCGLCGSVCVCVCVLIFL